MESSKTTVKYFDKIEKNLPKINSKASYQIMLFLKITYILITTALFSHPFKETCFMFSIFSTDLCLV